MIRICRLISLMVITAIFMTACSNENKPTTSELKAVLMKQMPDYITLESFTVKASQNYGDEVEPNYGSRFEATISPSSDLFEKVGALKGVGELKGVELVSLRTKEGAEMDIYGKISSRLYQGDWKHKIEIDGKPRQRLGLPLYKFSTGTIVRGSDEEKEFLAEKEREIERIKVETKENMPNADKIFLGTWDVTCTSRSNYRSKQKRPKQIYKKNGNIYYPELRVNLAKPLSAAGTWRIKGEKLYVRMGISYEYGSEVIVLRKNHIETKEKKYDCVYMRVGS